MSAKSVSALTIARGREAHLANVIRGLALQTVIPQELVVGVMQDAPFANLPTAPFPIRQILVPGDELPLAAARNAVANNSEGDLLTFIDVDCIPHPRFCEDYLRAASLADGLLMGEVLYLPRDAADVIDFATFDRVAVRHSDRRGPPERAVDLCMDYRCFWSLSFAMTRRDWTRSGGFDERYVGYGGEDTDFGRTLDEVGLPIWWTRGARVYHQFHDHFMPPIHHIRSILRNTEVFASKWGHRTMEHWLHAFRLMGLIENTPDGLRLLRDAGPEEIALCRQNDDQPYANSRRVIDLLQGIEGDARTGEARRAEVDRAQADLLKVAAE